MTAMNRKIAQLVKNGPDKYPGAKILNEKRRNISLRHGSRIIALEDGDIVHRHIMDNDAILFNRQPTFIECPDASHREDYEGRQHLSYECR